MATAEYQREWRKRNPDRQKAIMDRFNATPERRAYQREYQRRRRANGTDPIGKLRQQHAAICATAARVTDLWAAYFWRHEIDAGVVDDAIAQLDALVTEATD